MDTTMEEKLIEQKRNTAWSKYAVRINGWRFAGAIEPDGITRAICAAYVQPVHECENLVKLHSSLGASAGGLGLWNFFTMLFMLILGISVSLMIYKRFFLQAHIQKALREEVMLEVQSQLADYVPLEEGANRGGAAGGNSGQGSTSGLMMGNFTGGRRY